MENELSKDMKKSFIRTDLQRIKQDIIEHMEEMELEGSYPSPSETWLIERLKHFIVMSRSLK